MIALTKLPGKAGLGHYIQSSEGGEETGKLEKMVEKTNLLLLVFLFSLQGQTSVRKLPQSIDARTVPPKSTKSGLVWAFRSFRRETVC